MNHLSMLPKISNLSIKELLMTKSITLGTKTLQKLALTGTVAGLALMSQGAAADGNTTTIPVDMTGMNITKHEIAVMHVLSEICPPMLSDSQKQRFYKSYNSQLHVLMPTLEDPKAAIQYLSTQQDYRQILQGIRSWTLGFSKKENKALCEDLANASF